ncbi:hypothetical protein X556_0150 [Chlamydia pneumoniae B21]|nr:hypothetical protein X556_0150 [Chlamydia pneumoniae B21]
MSANITTKARTTPQHSPTIDKKALDTKCHNVFITTYKF